MLESEVYFILRGKIGFYRMLVKNNKIRFYASKEQERPKWALCFSQMISSGGWSNFLSNSYKNKYLKDLDLVYVENQVRLLKLVYVDGTVFYLHFGQRDQLENFIYFVYTRSRKSFSTLNVSNLFHKELPETIERSEVEALLKEKTPFDSFLQKVNLLLGRSVDLPSYQPIYPNLFTGNNQVRLMSENEVMTAFAEKLYALKDQGESKIKPFYCFVKLSGENWSAENLCIASQMFTDPQTFSSFCTLNEKGEQISGHKGVYLLNLLLESKQLRSLFLEWLKVVIKELLQSNADILNNYVPIPHGSQVLNFFNKTTATSLKSISQDIDRELNTLVRRSKNLSGFNTNLESEVPLLYSETTINNKKSISKFSINLKSGILQINAFRNYRVIYTTLDKRINQLRVDFATRELALEISSTFPVELNKNLICFLELHRMFICRSKSSRSLEVQSYNSGAVFESETLHEAPITHVISTGQNNIVVSLDEFLRVCVWNFLSKKNALRSLKCFDVPFKAVDTLQLVEEDRLLLIGNEKGVIRLYDYLNAALLKKVELKATPGAQIFWCGSPSIYLSLSDKSKRLMVYDLESDVVSAKQLSYAPQSIFVYKNTKGIYYHLVIAKDKIAVLDLPLLNNKKVVNFNTTNKTFTFHADPNILLSLKDDTTLVFINFDSFEID